jgi:hypothetical protein
MPQGSLRSGPWNNEEEKRYLKGVALYGMDFRKLQEYIGTRNEDQLRYYYRRNRGRPGHPPIPDYAPGMRGRPPNYSIIPPSKSPGPTKRMKVSSTSPGTSGTPRKLGATPQKSTALPAKSPTSLRGGSKTPGKRGRPIQNTPTLPVRSSSKRVKLDVDSSGKSSTASTSTGANGGATKAKSRRSLSKSNTGTPSAKENTFATVEVTSMGSLLSSSDTMMDSSPPPMHRGSGFRTLPRSSVKNATSVGDRQGGIDEQQVLEKAVENPVVVEEDLSPILGLQTINQYIAMLDTYAKLEGVQMAGAALLGFLVVAIVKYALKIV